MSHTIQVISGGFILLALMLAIGGLTRGKSGLRMSATLFIPLWLIASAINMTVGVVKAGYTVAEEAPIFLVVFGVPAVAAWIVRRLSAPGR